jgi:hypothetical protein
MCFRDCMISFVSIFLGSCFVYAQEQPIILGVLEDTPGHYVGDPHYRSVRVVFRKEGGDWKAFPDNCRDQKCLSSVTAEYPSAVN